MAYTALQLITRASYLSQIISRSLQTPDGEMIADGLYLLNADLEFKSTDIRLIPYFQEYFFTAVQGQEEYFIPNLLYTDSLVFNIGPVRYPMREMTRKDYFSTARVDNIQSLPFSYRTERTLDGTNVFLYFLPADTYAMTLWGKFGLTNVDLTTDLSLVYDQFYIEFLRYSLAAKFCEEWGSTFPDESKQKLMIMQKKLLDVSPPDLSIQGTSYFNRGPFFDWQSINLSKGWWPF